MIGNVPVTKFLSAEKLNEVVENTKKGGATLTGLIGTSAWLAPGAGTCLMVEAIVRNQGRILPCSVELQGEFGVKGAFVGVPVKLTAEGRRGRLRVRAVARARRRRSASPSLRTPS